MKQKSVVGDLINFRGLVYSPMNENGVIFLFGKVMEDLNMYIEEIKPGFPDCIGRRFNGKGWERILIEFEYLSSNFKLHKHDPRNCDMIICWEHDWPECSLEVIELKDVIKGLPNKIIQRPVEEIEDEGEFDKELDVDELKNIEGVNEIMMNVLEILDKEVKRINEDIWSKLIKNGLSFYSPERVFMYARLLGNEKLRVELFVGNGEIKGVEKRYKTSPKWGVVDIKSEAEIKDITNAIKTSHRNVKTAIKRNEPLNA